MQNLKNHMSQGILNPSFVALGLLTDVVTGAMTTVSVVEVEEVSSLAVEGACVVIWPSLFVLAGSAVTWLDAELGSSLVFTCSVGVVEVTVGGAELDAVVVWPADVTEVTVSVDELEMLFVLG